MLGVGVDWSIPNPEAAPGSAVLWAFSLSLCEPVGSAALGTRGVKTGRGSLSSGCWIVVVVGAGPGPEKYF